MSRPRSLSKASPFSITAQSFSLSVSYLYYMYLGPGHSKAEVCVGFLQVWIKEKEPEPTLRRVHPESQRDCSHTATAVRSWMGAGVMSDISALEPHILFADGRWQPSLEGTVWSHERGSLYPKATLVSCSLNSPTHTSQSRSPSQPPFLRIHSPVISRFISCMMLFTTLLLCSLETILV